MSGSEHINWDHHAVIGWLMRDGRMLAHQDAMITALGEQMDAAGAPVHRVRLSVRTLHPLLRAVTSTWLKGQHATPIVKSPHGFENKSAVTGSPIQIVIETGKSVRKRLESPLTPEDHVSLHELQAQGMTDYLALPLVFSSGGRASLIFSTECQGGFDDTDIQKLATLADSFAPVVEALSARQTALAVAEAYLGPRTGRRVLDGQITRGDIETIEAAILISDIRGWTQLNRELSPRDAMERANQYFELLADAIEGHGGEILKFLGDGLLAIFPTEAGADDACARALSAARQAHRAEGVAGVAFGIGLHFGEVLYGNIGSRTRIDFTVLGPSVNMVARIESLCVALDQPVLFSQAFADRLNEPVIKVGDHALKGLPGEVPVFRV
ncbi:adenylate/guanylate cyclase domain-containing protein [Phaeobacter marinintestinus]|uniref:adenylate/guanylate cyclase domain-containing protein n=1 Tax=Falsiphaeobacter marinintestinus TaxID=1492905 RepID=UPI0011B7FF6C|nr:adenylate/guanylate cyclase domain-containing protein [Phaeobacter marinintestinus]